MAYTINKTDGTVIATVNDGVLDTTSSMSLIGRNYQSYGETESGAWISRSHGAGLSISGVNNSVINNIINDNHSNYRSNCHGGSNMITGGGIFGAGDRT